MDAAKATKKNNYKSISKKLVICPSCFADPCTPLVDGIISCSSKSNTNIKQHYDRKHREVVFANLGDFEEVQSVVGDAPASASSRHSRQQSMKNYATNNALLPRAAAKGAVKQAIYKCVNDLGFPNSTVEHQLFREMLLAVKRHAASLEMTDLHLSNKAICAQRIDSYNNFMHAVTELVRKIRTYYKHLCGREVPFATICHDIWAGKKKDVLGVSLMFIDPRNCAVYKIPIGLIHTKGHSAAEVSRLTKKLMMSFGFGSDD